MKILVIDSDPESLESTAQALRNLGHEPLLAPSAALGREILQDEVLRLALLGLAEVNAETAPTIEALTDTSGYLELVVYSPDPSVEEAVLAIQSGALDFLAAPFSMNRLKRILTRIAEEQKVRRHLENLQFEVESSGPKMDFVTADPLMEEVLEMAATAAPSEASLLLLGESGTGKSVLARSIHGASTRADESFITINCPSLSKELFESELFGHVRGAFTGAHKDSWGKVAAADEGTLFLDEIGELPLELQPKLLRLLQEQEYERVGEHKPRKANVRIISATNRDLTECVERGEFREDLYYRLNVITLTLPRLAQRPRDLSRLASSYLEFFARQLGRPILGFSQPALEALAAYAWPGNLRELRNCVERAAILTTSDFVDVAHLPRSIRNDPEQSVESPRQLVSLAEMEKAHLKFVIETTATLEEAAKVLGIDQSTLFRKRKRYALA